MLRRAKHLAGAPPGLSDRAFVEAVLSDAAAYWQRNRVERLVGRRKPFRGVATRYDKLATSFLALVHLVFAFVMLR